MDKFFAISAKRNSPVGKNRALSSLIKKLTAKLSVHSRPLHEAELRWERHCANLKFRKSVAAFDNEKLENLSAPLI